MHLTKVQLGLWVAPSSRLFKPLSRLIMALFASVASRIANTKVLLREQLALPCCHFLVYEFSHTHTHTHTHTHKKGDAASTFP